MKGKTKLKTLWLLLVCTLQLQAAAFSQHTKFDIALKHVTVSEVFRYLEEVSVYRFVYDSDVVDRMDRVSVNMKGTELRQVLESVLRDSGMGYVVEDDIVIIRPEAAKVPGAEAPQPVQIKGVVKDKTGQVLPGVTVLLKGTTAGVVTDADGQFRLEVPQGGETVLVFSFVGMKSQEVAYKGEQELKVVMEENVEEMDEVVVTGIFSKSKESYTGAVSVVTEKELKSFGNRNVLTTLRNIDPSFNILESNEWGSNPNRLPEIQIRGAANMPDIDQLTNDTKAELNTPLIIMDGFEITLERMMDLDDSEIQSITLLKDASATAIYGSRGANGVVVIATKEPEAGKLRFSYTGSVNIEVPDLTDYDVLDAREKLDLELRSGYYDGVRAEDEVRLKQKYNDILKQVERGVNTYWLSKPLRVGVGHRHNVKLEGGDRSFRYSATVQYNDVAGVMKESFRRTFNGGINLSYKTSKLLFRNQLNIALNKAQESPYGKFEDYVKLNPYWTERDEHGNMKRFFDEDIPYWGSNPANPLYDATLNTKETSDYTNITNNFSIEWKPIEEFTLRGTFGIYTQMNHNDKFLPPEHSSFAETSEEYYFKRGSYEYGTMKSSRYNFSATASYTKVFGEKHMIYAGLNMDLEEKTSRGYTFQVQGFSSGKLDFLALAMQYAEDGKPSGSESKSRRVGLVGNVNYSFEDRYFLDASFRTDGSSLYGSNRRFAPFWSAGIGWNVHREAFMADVAWLNRLKIRASVGETGANNFSAYEAMATYKYVLGDRYYNWMGAQLRALANPELEWQKTMKYNGGVELNVLNNRLSVVCDLYLERTNGLMSSLELAPSNGFPSYKANIGELENKGFELKVTGYLVRDTERELVWSVTGSLVRNKDKIIKLSEAMKEANEKLLATGGSTPNKVWQEGDSQNAIYAVPSLGIDPSNGKELFLKKNGEVSYTWNAGDRVFCGVDQPDYRGNINTMFLWKNLSVNLSFGYEWGGQTYNQTLIDRVENADKKYNVDRRVYDDRWKEPGDRTFFKGINETSKTNATSRFVQDEAVFNCQNVNVTYALRGNKWLKHNLGVDALTLKGDLSDVFRFSTIRQERGTSYPFSRQFSFTLSALF